MATVESDIIKIPGVNPHSDRRLIVVIHFQPPEGVKELVQTVADLGTGGCGLLDSRSLVSCNSAVRPDIQHIDLGHDPAR